MNADCLFRKVYHLESLKYSIHMFNKVHVETLMMMIMLKHIMFQLENAQKLSIEGFLAKQTYNAFLV